MKPIKILIIDDDHLFVFLNKKIIVTTGIKTEVMVIGNGEKSINYLTSICQDIEKLPDIIFLDIRMPVMDGWEFLEEYKLIEKTLVKKISLFLVSSSISPNEIEQAKSNSLVKDFLMKPLEKVKLIELFKNTQH
jgi:CheY-like chemotaxis protein